MDKDLARWQASLVGRLKGRALTTRPNPEWLHQVHVFRCRCWDPWRRAGEDARCVRLRAQLRH